jgi:molybdopterin converting factor small subunit
LTQYLKVASDRRKELREKIERYKALKDGLAPLQDAQQNVQQNLCTRDSEVEKELEKMRMLMARVRGRLSGLEERPANDDEDVDMGSLDDHLKVQALLGTL